MNIDFSDKELLFLYGRLKRDLSSLQNSKSVKTSKSEIRFYESMLLKIENAYPLIKNLPV